MDAYASNETPNHAKRKCLSKYSDVNQAVWDWYTMCRNSNIPVSGSMLQEATLIAICIHVCILNFFCCMLVTWEGGKNFPDDITGVGEQKSF